MMGLLVTGFTGLARAAGPPALPGSARPLLPPGIQLQAQALDVGFERPLLALQLAPAALELLAAGQGRFAQADLLELAGRAGQHPLRADVHLDQLDAAVGEQELPYLVRVRHAARFEDVE